MPVDTRFMTEEKVPSSEEFALEGKTYRVTWKDSSMVMVEKSGESSKNYDIIWSLGGKNVFCFLTPLDKGRLQTIPLAWDVIRQTWFNYPQSAVRHFVEDIDDEPLPWKDRMYTFNTGCYNCHVSQLSTYFDLTTETYHTTWREAGINCETCHGPSAEHVRICREAGEGEVPEDLKIISTRVFTPDQHNASCGSCHAKMRPITASYLPGTPFFDHFDLATWEDPDFYPDGRDLGETYTLTGWMMNQCMREGDLHCATCHTSSGRTRYMGSQSNQLCMPCHQEKVEKVAVHSGHPEDSPGALCVNCHMPKREFVGHFIRSDHSFRPPMPLATLKFGSPNACNNCHSNKSPEWAAKIVESRKNKTYQNETLTWAQRIKEAREENWENLDQMVEIIKEDRYGEIVTNSLVRLLDNCHREEKWDALRAALENESPLVRSSAASGLTGIFTQEVKEMLITACTDDFRLVRIAAALTLSTFPEYEFTPQQQIIRNRATEEYKESLRARPDDWSAHYNMGIFYQNKGELSGALDAYALASRLYPDAILPLVNSSVLYSYTGNLEKAEENLREAIRIDPGNEAANLNMGLLLAETGRKEEAKKALEKVLQGNPGQAVAAYNVSVLYAENNLQKAIEYAAMAANEAPDNPKYGYTLSFYQNQAGHRKSAIKTLQSVIGNSPDDLNSVYLLGDLYCQEGDTANAVALFKDILKRNTLPETDRIRIRRIISEMAQ
jgi:tetratricopeptide (TPR) repeat protein